MLAGAALGILLSFSSLAYGDSLSSSGSSSVSVTAALNWTSNNCAASYSICSSNLNSSSFPSPTFSVTVPGLTLPSNTVITDATLSFNFANTSTAGGYSFASYSAVDPGYYYTVSYPYSCGFSTCYNYSTYYYSYTSSAPSYSVTGNLDGTFASVSSPDNTASLGNQNGGSLDLLAAGFGSDLAAGDSLTLSGNATSSLNFLYTYDGYNANSTVNMSANLTATPQATLTIDYASIPDPDPSDTPEPGSFAMLGLGIIGLGAMRKRAIC
jgi:hypothetical protein